MLPMVAALARPKVALTALAAVSALGAADVGEFLATRTQLVGTAPGRAAGSVLGLTIWLGLVALAVRRMRRDDKASLRAATLGLAAVNALGNAGLTFIHFKAGVGGWRPLLGGVLGLSSLLLALLARDAD